MQGLLSCHSGLDPESFSTYLHTMADVHNKATTAANQTGNSCMQYTVHDKKLPGKPDIVLPKYKTNRERVVTILKK